MILCLPPTVSAAICSPVRRGGRELGLFFVEKYLIIVTMEQVITLLLHFTIIFIILFLLWPHFCAKCSDRP